MSSAPGPVRYVSEFQLAAAKGQRISRVRQLALLFYPILFHTFQMVFLCDGVSSRQANLPSNARRKFLDGQ